MPQDAFTLRFIAKELDRTLRGGKINKINQPEREELALLIYTGKRTVKLTVNANASDCGIYFSQDEKENPLTAPNFCMLLRKYVQNAEILGIEQVLFERIIAIHLACHSDFSACERILYVEIMGKYSNVLLCEKGVILGGMKMTSLEENHRRILMSGAKYTLPEPQDKVDPTDLSALKELLITPQENMANFLFTHVAGLAPCTAEQIVRSYTGGGFAEHVHRYIFSEEVSPCVVERNGVPTDFLARFVEGAIPFETLSDAQAYFYTKKRTKKALDRMRRKLESAVLTARKKQEKRLAQILDKYKECEDMERNRIKGELITANLYALSRGMQSCELYNYYDENGGTLKITLDSTLTPAQNAQRYYKKYQKQKRTLEALLPQEEEMRAELDYSQSLLCAIAAADGEEDLRSVEEELISAGLVRVQKNAAKKKKAEIPYRTYEKMGFRIFAGRNNLQNDRLVRQSSGEDTWLHTQKYHSSHVVIKAEGREIPDEVLLYAAQICARYSDGKSGEKIPVDYCLVRHVKKPSGSKAGFVVYTDYKTLLVDPLREELS